MSCRPTAWRWFRFHFADLWDHAAFKAVRDRLVKEEPDFAEHFTKELGVAPDDVERLTGRIARRRRAGGLDGLRDHDQAV